MFCRSRSEERTSEGDFDFESIYCCRRLKGKKSEKIEKRTSERDLDFEFIYCCRNLRVVGKGHVVSRYVMAAKGGYSFQGFFWGGEPEVGWLPKLGFLKKRSQLPG